MSHEGYRQYFSMPTSRGGYPLPVTSQYRDGYQCTGVPPIVSKIVIAIGQLPTDSFGAELINCLTVRASGARRIESEGQPGRRRPAIRLRRTRANANSQRDSAMAVSSHWRPIN